MIKFYYNLAPNPTKVALFLEEAGLPYLLDPFRQRLHVVRVAADHDEICELPFVDRPVPVIADEVVDLRNPAQRNPFDQVELELLVGEQVRLRAGGRALRAVGVEAGKRHAHDRDARAVGDDLAPGLDGVAEPALRKLGREGVVGVEV